MPSSTQSAASASKTATVPQTKWPDATPTDSEDQLVSIVCGNSHLHWAFHNGVKNDVNPALFWR
eukprot:9017601-Ditylum_brightwellii.AAC.1